MSDHANKKLVLNDSDMRGYSRSAASCSWVPFLIPWVSAVRLSQPEGAAGWMSSGCMPNVRKANQWQNLKLESPRILTSSFVLERQELHLSLGEELETYS